MTKRKIQIPEGMLKAVDEAIGNARKSQSRQLADRDGELWPNDAVNTTLEAALGWLDEILHQRNPDFHRAILKREREYFPGDDADMSVIVLRVNFEYGVSFARNYIRGMFVAQEPEVPEEIKDLMVFDNCLDTSIPAKQHNEYMLKAFRAGQGSKESK